MQNEDHRLFIYRIDLEDRISFVNDEWIAFGIENGLTELSEKEVVGRPCLIRYVFRCLQNRASAIKTGEPLTVDGYLGIVTIHREE